MFLRSHSDRPLQQHIHNPAWLRVFVSVCLCHKDSRRLFLGGYRLSDTGGFLIWSYKAPLTCLGAVLSEAAGPEGGGRHRSVVKWSPGESLEPSASG